MNFSKWKAWDNRKEHLDIIFPGIYAISISNENIEGKPFNLSDNIVYFGMTNAVHGLKGRLEQFNNSLRDKKGGGHGGALRFRFDFPDGEKLSSDLFVAVLAFPCNIKDPQPDDLRQMGNVSKAEYDAFALFSERYGTLPKYNDKKLRPQKIRSYQVP